jgi:hypothetical protein
VAKTIVTFVKLGEKNYGVELAPEFTVAGFETDVDAKAWLVGYLIQMARVSGMNEANRQMLGAYLMAADGTKKEKM